MRFAHYHWLVHGHLYRCCQKGGGGGGGGGNWFVPYRVNDSHDFLQDCPACRFLSPSQRQSSKLQEEDYHLEPEGTYEYS